jgi:hypothetical protein
MSSIVNFRPKPDATGGAVNQASQIKRHRATKTEVERRRNALYEIIAEMQPMTVRQVFYQATVKDIVEKTEAGYNKVQTDLTIMRKGGVLPYKWLTDNTRWQRKPDSYSSVQQALEDTARLYRKSLWDDVNAYVEIWLEKDALAGVVLPVTYAYDVPLMSARGYASLSFLHSAAEYIGKLEVPTFIYHFGDYDPSGVNAAEKIEQTLHELAPNADIYFERVAVTPIEIARLSLPTRPTKQTDTRARKFGDDISVELDAMHPNELRSMVERVINRHLPQDRLKVLQAAEESERKLINGLVGMLSESSR